MQHRLSGRRCWFTAALIFHALSLLAATDLQVTFDPYKHVIWIPVQVNGGPQLIFAMDNAAAFTVLDWDRAQELKIPFTSLGEKRNVGSGDGVARIGEIKKVRLALPGLALDLDSIRVVPLRGVSETYGHPMDGLVGVELFHRYVVELDWERARMVLHEPKKFHYSGEGAVVPLIIADGRAYVHMEISVPGAEPVEGIFLIDCPHPGAVIINQPFVRQNGLLEAARRTLPRLVTQYAEGVGGKSEILYGRIASLKLGPFTLNQPVVGFSQARAGSLAHPGFSGILGAEILRRFRVILDYSRERMILEPKSSLAQPYLHDASGMRLRSSGPDYREYRITGIVENSAAERAGLKEGDRLIEINGKPAKSLAFGEVLELLKHDGETISLKIERGSETVDVTLSLRRLI